MKKIILDVDTGIDDALAIAYALKSKELHVEGITTGFGNVSVELATENTLKVIEMVKPNYEVPVVMGASKPLYREKPAPLPHIHGENGIGNFVLPKPIQQPINETADDFIIRKVYENLGKITLVFVGRLTNLALVMQKDPSIKDKVENVIIMGGTIHTSGNVGPISEANISGDPEAARIVFESGLPITMVGLDATTKANFKQEDLDYLMSRFSTDCLLKNFIHGVINFGFETSVKRNRPKERYLHDPLAVGVAINRELVTTQDLYIEVETEGRITTGATIAEFRLRPVVPNAKVCLDTNKERFFKHFIDTIVS